MGYSTHSRDDPQPEESPRGIPSQIRRDRPPYPHWPKSKQDSHREKFPARIQADSQRISHLGRKKTAPNRSSSPLTMNPNASD